MSITEHTTKTARHTSFYLAAGPENGPLIIFLHGWPELSISWRHQLPALASLGFRAIAPDMRGYGRSGVYSRHEDYAQEHIVRDMIELLQSLGREKAVWVGHDWGSPVAWNVASHHPEHTEAVANLCVPYYTIDRGLEHTLTLVDRKLYPADEFPYGQWDYMRYYEESFAEAIAPMDADVEKFLKIAFRKGNSEGEGQRAITSNARRGHGMLGGPLPDLPRDPDVVSQRLRIGAAAQRILRSVFLVHEPRRQRRLRQDCDERRIPRNAGAVSERALRLRVRGHSLAARRADADLLSKPERGHDSQRTLDGPGKAARGQCGGGEVARDESPRRLAATELAGSGKRALQAAPRCRA
jgi:pimeloyl-ACP methyl ester carboxylesterase